MSSNQDEKIQVEIAGSYKMVQWIVGLCTFGIGALAMHLSAQPWPKELDEDGITTRSGKRYKWDDIEKATAITVVDQLGRRVTGRLDLKAGKDTIKVVTQSIVPADRVLDMVQRKLGNDRIVPG